jgi:ABC-type multidrug transport system permease subunit
MQVIESLCPPALLFAIFLALQLGLDTALGLFATAVVKAILGGAVVLILDMFCGVELSVVSWFLIATPFIISALATAIAIGTGFDAKVLNGLVYETFKVKSAKTDDLPADSNAVNPQE